MPGRVANRGLRPVHSLKHIVDVATSTVTNVITTIPVIESAQNPGLANVTQVEDGSTVNAIYLRVEVIATAVFDSVPRIYMLVFKDPGTGLSIPPPSGAGGNADKKFIIHQEMTMVGGKGGVEPFPRTMFSGVIRIPPRLKRFGYSDRLILLFQHDAGEGTGITNVCIQSIYKEFR